MLREKLAVFFQEHKDKLSTEDSLTLTRNLIAYAIGLIEGSQLRRVSRDLGMRDEVIAFRSGFIDASPYMTSRFWRAMFKWAKKKSTPDKIAKEFGVNTQDIWFALDMLSEDQISKLIKKAKVATYVEHPSKTEFEELSILLRRVAYSITKHKLRFIHQNDFGVSEDDLAMELLAEGIRVMNIYDYDSNIKKIKNFTIRSMKNHSIRIIEHYTAQCRQRVVRTQIGDKEKNTVSEYAATTLSLSYEMGNGLTLASLISDDSDHVEDRVIEKDFFSKIVMMVPADVRRILEITFGISTDQQFEKYLSDKKVASNISDHELLNHACAFFNVPKTNVERAVFLHI